MAPKGTTQLLKSLRLLMKDSKIVPQPLHAYVVPSGDAHQNEYISACDCRREFISGFSGSAGTAVVTQCSAALWVDGRYHLQADAQTDENWLVMKQGLKDTPTIADWLHKTITEEGGQIGVDSSVMSSGSWSTLSSELEVHGLNLVPVNTNLIDAIWSDRPERPNNPLLTLDLKYTGKSWAEKVKLLRTEMKKQNCSVCVLTALDDIAWLLNLRGSDIPLNPVFYSYVIVTEGVDEDVSLFIDEVKNTADVTRHLQCDDEMKSVKVLPYHHFDKHLSAMVESKSKIWLPKGSSQRIHADIPKKKKYVTDNSHVTVIKAVKNDAEISGMRNAHYKDAVTLCEFFSWLEKEIKHNRITESAAATKLELIKRSQEDYISLSFDTISSSGPNAAINHYKPVPGEDLVIDNAGIFLLDSGAQYRDGTTDVTRTVHFGTPSEYERECYTRVLKGHIQLACAVWPKGVKGSNLDSLARMHLWSAGLDFKHGTGHGVGAFLNVHEGPCAIGNRTRPGEVALEAGMIVTDEPGYYEDGKFGIRIENCMLVKDAMLAYNFKDTGFLQMEPITLVPISTKLIEPSLLNQQEIDWINKYHETVVDKIAPLLKESGKTEALEWLMREAAPLG